jgi:hypothetical protein
MNQSERYIEITRLLEMFKHGEELYRSSPIFNQAIQMMIEGISIYDVFEEVIISSERIQRAFTDYVNRDTRL